MTFSLNFGVDSRVFLAPSIATLSGSHISVFYENLVFPLMVPLWRIRRPSHLSLLKLFLSLEL